METQEPISNDWRDDVSEPSETLKIADKEVVEFSFLDDGEKKSHPDFGNSVKFQVSIENPDGQVEKSWYVNATNYDLLGQIKGLGELKGLKVRVKRTGTKRSDTRYTIEKAE
jgi:hypothetical protein